MWDPTPSSTASPSDSKQNIKEIVDVDNCKCSGGVEQVDQQQKNNSKKQTARFSSQVSGSYTHELQGDNVDEVGDGNTKYSDFAEETTDSGFISGPQTSSSTNLDIDQRASDLTSCEKKKLNITEPSSESQVHNKNKQQELNFDSGIIEEEYDDSECDLGQQTKQSNKPGMLLPHSVESGISEWFCNLSLQNSAVTSTSAMSVSGTGLNNLNAPREPQSVQQPKTPHVAGSIAQQYQQQYAAIPQQVTAANAWEKFYKQNDDGDTSLHLACISGYEEAVIALIRMAPHPCLFNMQNDLAQTPLHLATLTAHPRIIRMLLLAGAKPTVRDRHGNTPLHLACISGEEQCVRALTMSISASEVHEAHRQYGHRANDTSYLKYVKLPSDLEIRNYDGERCVHLAAQAGFINILRTLVVYGADINAREGKSGRTPLHIAIEGCNEELTSFLLDECQTVNLETATYAGLTAYQVACILNKSEIQKILRRKGAEPLTPPDSDYDSTDSEDDLDDPKLYDRFGDPGYFSTYNGGNAMRVA